MRGENDPSTAPLRLIPLPSWLWLGVLALTVGSGVIYGFFGEVTRVVEGLAAVRLDTDVRTVAAPRAGIVREILAKRGTLIEADAPVIELTSDVLQTEIEQTKDLLAFLEQEYAGLLEGQQKMIAEANLRREAVIRESEEAKRTAAELLKLRSELLASQERLLERGLISQETILETRTTVAALESRIVGARTRTANAEVEVAQLKATVAADRADRRETRRAAKTRLASLEAELSESFTVRSLIPGRVEDVFARPGTAVAKGDILARLEPVADADARLRLTALIPQAKGKVLSIGDAVQAVPMFVDKSRYGFIHGRLTWVATYAAAPEELALVSLDPTEMERLRAEFGPLLLAEVELSRNPHTQSGLSWSTKEGWPGTIGPGVLCNLQIVFGKDRPVELLFPWIRSLLGG